MSTTIAGTFSGLNVSSIIQSIIAADSIPITNLQTADTNLQSTNTTLSALSTSLGQLSLQLQNFGFSTIFSTQAATLSNSSVGTAAVTQGAVPGTINLNVTKVATNTVLNGSTATEAFSGNTQLNTVLGETSIAGQTFTINGTQITLSDSTVLDDGNPNSTNSVIGLINNSGAGVTATYDSSSGKISLSSTSSNPIILGSSTDTSDFLQQAQLFNNGSGSVTSNIAIGRIDPNTSLQSANLNAPLTAGNFTINGVQVTYNAGDTLNNLIGNINSSNAGVTAVYDTYENRIVLSSTERGPQNITVSDGTSNAATALGLNSTQSQLQLGQATLFTVGSDPTVREADSGTLTSSDLGVGGLSFNVTGTGSTTITLAPDTTTVANALNAFVAQYNTTQTLIATDTSVDPSGTNPNGPLSTDLSVTFLASQLREVTSGSTSNTAAVRMLADLGINTNANDNTLTQVDPTKLQDALENHLSDVENLFNNAATGLTNTVQNVIDEYDDPISGVITAEQADNTSQVQFNQQLINGMNENIANEQTRLETEFAALDSLEGTTQGLSGVLNGTTSSSTSSSSSSTGSSSIGSVGSSTPSS